MTPLRRNAIIRAGPAASIPGPTSTKIAPPIIEATPIIIACESERLRISPDEFVSSLIIEPTELHLNKSVVVMTINQISTIAETGRLYSLQISRISDSDSALE